MTLDTLLTELTCGDDDRAEAAASALAAQGEATLPVLRELLDAGAPRGRVDVERSDRRWWAARSLALIDSPAAVALLLPLLSDPDADLRACAIAALGARRAVEAVSALVAALADPSPYLSRLASDALIQIGPPAVPDLIRALQTSASQQTRIHAARALALLAAPESIPALYHALEDDSSLVQYWADEALERLGLGMIYFNA
jgi:HEAT repeat protein